MPLSSPRAGQGSVRAESARAVTGRRCPHSGEGKDFLTRRPSFFYEYSHNSGSKSRKLIPRCNMNRLSKGYKRTVDKILGRMATNGCSGQKPSFWAKKKTTTWPPNPQIIHFGTNIDIFGTFGPMPVQRTM